MHDDVDAFHRLIHVGALAGIPFVDRNAVAFGVVEVGDVERGDLVPALQQIARQVNAEKASASGDQKRLLLRLFSH